MNAHKPIVSRTAVEDPRGPKTFTVDMDVLRNLSCEDLWHLQDALQATRGVLTAYLCQPRYSDDDNVLSPAGDYLENLMQVLDSVHEGITNVAAAADPDDEKGIHWRAWILIQYHASIADDLHEVSAIAVEAIRDGHTAQMNARRIAFDAKRGMST